MKKKKDYYKVLGVERSATCEEIKKAYRIKALAHHPDRNKGDKKSEELFKEASEAYQVLSDKDKKARYDRGDEYIIDFDPSIYAQMFGNFNFGGFNGFGGPNNQRSRAKRKRSYGVHFTPNPKIIYRATIEDIIKGKKIEVPLTRHITCEKCKGNGAIELEDQCEVCKGQGTLNSINGNMYFSMTCGECGGAGKKAEKCKKCEGRGFKSVQEKAMVNIPAGIGPLSALKMSGKGNTVYFDDKMTTGDTYVVIDYPQKEKGVRLSNGDIHTSITVPFNTIMSESEIKVDILGCKEIALKLDSSKNTGHQYKIEHQGVTDKNNAFIKVFIDLPKNKIDEGSKKKITDLMEEVYGSPTLQFRPETALDNS